MMEKTKKLKSCDCRINQNVKWKSVSFVKCAFLKTDSVVACLLSIGYAPYNWSRDYWKGTKTLKMSLSPILTPPVTISRRQQLLLLSGVFLVFGIIILRIFI